ncbi:hypothetical protein ABFS82_10G078400 [Erythranthe guttata]
MDDQNLQNGSGSSSNKVTGIRQIVKLKSLLQKWQNVTFGPKDETTPRPAVASSSSRGGISPEVIRRLRSSSNLRCESDEDTCQSPEPAHGVPKGFLAVYVGPELRRFIIPMSYLSDPLFKVLLAKAEEEFGFDHSGGLTIPCEIETFKYLLHCMENHRRELSHET